MGQTVFEVQFLGFLGMGCSEYGFEWKRVFGKVLSSELILDCHYLSIFLKNDLPCHPNPIGLS